MITTLATITPTGAIVKTSTLASGARKAQVLTRAEWRKTEDGKGLSASEAKRRYVEYLHKQGVSLNASLASRMTGGELVTKAVQINAEKGTWTASGVLASHKSLVAPVAKATANEAALKAAQDEVASLKGQLQALLDGLSKAAAK